MNQETYNPSRALKITQIVLLILIIIGVALLCTQKKWVPRLVDFILAHENLTER